MPPFSTYLSIPLVTLLALACAMETETNTSADDLSRFATPPSLAPNQTFTIPIEAELRRSDFARNGDGYVSATAVEPDLADDLRGRAEAVRIETIERPRNPAPMVALRHPQYGGCSPFGCSVPGDLRIEDLLQEPLTLEVSYHNDEIFRRAFPDDASTVRFHFELQLDVAVELPSDRCAAGETATDSFSYVASRSPPSYILSGVRAGDRVHARVLTPSYGSWVLSLSSVGSAVGASLDITTPFAAPELVARRVDRSAQRIDSVLCWRLERADEREDTEEPTPNEPGSPDERDEEIEGEVVAQSNDARSFTLYQYDELLDPLADLTDIDRSRATTFEIEVSVRRPHIYSNATSVRVMVGSASPATARVLDAVDGLDRASRDWQSLRFRTMVYPGDFSILDDPIYIRREGSFGGSSSALLIGDRTLRIYQ